MNNETKNEVKKNVATGASTAAGATAGVVIGAAIAPEKAEAQEVPVHDINTKPEATHKPEAFKPEAKPEAVKPEAIKPEEPVKPEVVKPEEPVKPENPAGEVEVLGYDRVTDEYGNTMDIAVVNANGNEIGILDVNLDGQADALVCDINQNGVLEQGEIEIIEGQGMSMHPFAEAAGFNVEFAQNNLPDYCNDANVDNYMA